MSAYSPALTLIKRRLAVKTIRELLKVKGNPKVHCVSTEDTVFDAVTCMVENNIGSVLVMEDDQIKGIMSERDYLRFITALGRTARDTPVTELMTAKVIYLTPSTSLDNAMAIMTESRIRHIPILEEGQLLGIVSIGDLVKQISADREIHIKTLTQYISDAYPG
jgi:CBS domain-containing protein